MSCLENMGRITRCRRRKNGFCWELLNYFADALDFCEKEHLLPYLISSPYFSVFDIEWRLVLIRQRKRNECTYIGLFLWKKPSYKLSSPVAVHLGLSNCDGDFLRKQEGETDITGCFGSWTYAPISLFYDLKQKYSPTGIIRISCEIVQKKPPVINAVPQKTLKDSEDIEKEVLEETTQKVIPEDKAKGVDRLVQNLKNLLLNGQGSDVTLKVEDREFNVHRGILMVRSPVFSSMLQHDTKENATGVVDIPDCSEDAFQMFLTYIYTGSIDTVSSDNVCDLYYTADKYQVHDLKDVCVEFMENNLSVENFCEIMTLSLQHSEAGLQKTATRFFCENVKTIIKTVQWQKYMKDYTIQANELYIKAINA